MTKNMMVKALSDFMASKGVESMTLAEYKAEGNDVPVKDYLLRRTLVHGTELWLSLSIEPPSKYQW